MSSDLWVIKSRVIPASHIRGVARGARNEYSGRPLRMEVKQYIPKSNPNPQPGDLTIFMAHGIASAKECYEPLFDDLLRALDHSPVRIRGIWAADAPYNGKSYLLNKDDIGDEVSWLDYPRDTFHMINHFQTQMPPPIIGIGQSLGVGSVFLPSSWHPRLFAGIVALEPALGPDTGVKWPAPTYMFPGVTSARRRDLWPSREAARRDYVRSRYYGAFDARVLDKIIQHELTEVDPSSSSVTLTTPKFLESAAWMHADPPLANSPLHPESDISRDRATLTPGFKFYQPDAHHFHDCLPSIHPPVLFVWGGKSPMTSTSRRKFYANTVGSGVGGCGKAGITEANVEGAGHTVSLEKPRETAGIVGRWLEERWEIWQREMKEARGREYSAKVRQEWMERIDEAAGAKL